MVHVGVRSRVGPWCRSDAAELRGAVERLGREVAGCAPAELLRRAEKAIAALDAQSKLTQRTVMELEGAMQEAKRAVLALEQGKASVEEVERRAESTTVDAALARMDERLGQCAPRDGLRGTGERLESVHAQVEVLAKQCDVAMRFVDWFATRGSSYEHNYKALEAQLQRLASSSLVPGATRGWAEQRM